MMVVTHAFTGAAVGTLFESPVLAFILGAVLHLLIDKIPHLLPEEKRARFKNQLLDGMLTILSLIFIYYLAIRNGHISILTGALGGVSVDVVLVVIAGIYKPLHNSKIRKWHAERQSHKENYWYLVTDIALVGLSLIILYK